ncbi:hypothetical protein, partial [Thioalkalivibrio sp. ALMg11]|uniref:hypothetical protein n=1 Tax=Thioalkalivibrio sp. ALMg11 TaxID=1158165 RepID=UPI000476BDA9
MRDDQHGEEYQQVEQQGRDQPEGLEQAEHNLNRHVQESPGSLQGIRTLTAIYLEQDRVEDALQFVERASRDYTGE